MKLILEAIKALFRKVECGFSAVRDYVDSKVSAESKKLAQRLGKAEILASDASYQAEDALNLAQQAKTEAAKGLRCYDKDMWYAYPQKTSPLEVGETTILVDYPAALATFLESLKFGDVVRICLAYYNASGTRYGTDVDIVANGSGAGVGYRWVVVDGVAQCYEVKTSIDAFNSHIRRLV